MNNSFLNFSPVVTLALKVLLTEDFQSEIRGIAQVWTFSSSAETGEERGWGQTDFKHVRYRLLAICVAAQAFTIAMTWSLWQIRVHPPHLPLIDLPRLPFGWLMVGSLMMVMARPKFGMLLHASVLLLSFVFDQFRTQPQFIAIAMLMFAVVDSRATSVSKWFLISLWLWAGLHKLLSPDWLGHRSWELVASLGLDPQEYYRTVAILIAVSETALGLIAIVRPRMAAILCVLLHIGIVLVLSPWGMDWNTSVIPWNICTAAVGYWILRNSTSGLPQTSIEACAAIIFLLMPIGFYTGHVDHGIANVLYSDNLPRGLISNEKKVAEIDGWGRLRVPFPNERRLFRSFFERSALPGSKLHIFDPRPFLEDQYFLKRTDGTVVEVTPSCFFDPDTGSAAGIGFDSPRSIFALSQNGARLLKRTPDSMIYAVEIPPESYNEGLLKYIAELPNLEQLQLAGCRVKDRDLRHLGQLYKLVGIGLDDTEVTDAGLRYLAHLPSLRYIEYRNAQLIESDLQRLRGQ